MPERAAIEAMQALGMPPLVGDGLMRLNAAIKAGRSTRLTDAVAQLTGQPPRSVSHFAQERPQWGVC